MYITVGGRAKDLGPGGRARAEQGFMTENQSDACVFCKIARHREDAAAYVVHEDSLTMAFLDRSPLFHGHCLLIPKAHYSTLLDCDDATIAHLFVQSKRLARAILKASLAEGFFVGMNNRISQSVPHMHVHLVPRRKKDGLKGFFWPRRAYKDEAEMEGVRAAIAKAMAEPE